MILPKETSGGIVYYAQRVHTGCHRHRRQNCNPKPEGEVLTMRLGTNEKDQLALSRSQIPAAGATLLP